MVMTQSGYQLSEALENGKGLGGDPKRDLLRESRAMLDTLKAQTRGHQSDGTKPTFPDV